MLQRDHLTIIAPSLAEGIDHVRACLDIDIPYGRTHPDMGTHNHLLRLGDDVYLEVIAADPAAPKPPHPRWFGLDDTRAVRASWEAGLRLRGWVARSDDLASLVARHGDILGESRRLTGGGSHFFFAVPRDGSLPLGGLAPSVIDRVGRPPSIAAMKDLGARLQAFVVEHPRPDEVRDLYRLIGAFNPPQVKHGAALRYRTTIATPAGLKDLF